MRTLIKILLTGFATIIVGLIAISFVQDMAKIDFDDPFSSDDNGDCGYC